MLPRELGNVALKMLRTQRMEGALVRPLEHGPEALDPVGVRHVTDVLPGRVLDRLMVCEPLIPAVVIGVDHRVRLHMAFDEPL